MIYYGKTLFGSGPKLTAVHELAQDTQDKRQRLLKPTDKLKKMINELGKNFFD